MKRLLVSFTGLMLLAVCLINFSGCEQPSVTPAVPAAPTYAYAWEAPRRHVVAFGCEHCAPCREQKPQLDQVRAAGIDVTEVDVDKSPEIAQNYHVYRVPTYIMFEDGHEVKRVESVTLLLIALRALVWVLTTFVL